eukprot:4788008-Lingulodinium_polyedra.AAC.1
MAKYVKRVVDIKNLAVGIPLAALGYNQRVASVLAHTLQLAPPSKELLRTESWALNKLQRPEVRHGCEAHHVPPRRARCQRLLPGHCVHQQGRDAQ